MFDNKEFEIDKRVNIFELLPPVDLYKKQDNISNYLSNEIFDAYHFYPEIYKNIGNYLYNNYFFNNRKDVVNNINVTKIYQMVNDTFQYLISNQNYINEEYQLLKDIVLIVVLDELERNNYQISE